jgi:DNA polymerase-4
VARRLHREGLKGRTIRLKLRLADFTTFTRQTTTSFPTDDQETIFEEARRLLARAVRPGRRFRLLGVVITSLSAASREEQPTLFSLH